MKTKSIIFLVIGILALSMLAVADVRTSPLPGMEHYNLSPELSAMMVLANEGLKIVHSGQGSVDDIANMVRRILLASEKRTEPMTVAGLMMQVSQNLAGIQTQATPVSAIPTVSASAVATLAAIPANPWAAVYATFSDGSVQLIVTENGVQVWPAAPDGPYTLTPDELALYTSGDLELLTREYIAGAQNVPVQTDSVTVTLTPDVNAKGAAEKAAIAAQRAVKLPFPLDTK